MPRFSHVELHRIGCQLFEAAGCSVADAATVDGHGAIRFYEYVDKILDGSFDPAGQPAVVSRRGCTAIVDGGGGFGQVGGRLAIELAMELARDHGVATTTLRNAAHVGRAGAYPLMAAREGFMAMAFVNAGRMGRQIAPFGGIDGKLSTNPIAFAAPRPNAEPIIVDMSTSIVAEGKVRMANNKGEQVPEGWLIDHEGNQTTDPAALLGDPPGAMLPLGGSVGYKGYGLGLVVELWGGLLSGEGTATNERVFKSNGVSFTVYDPSFFVDDETYEREVTGLIDHVMSSRVAPGFERIMLPGEVEFRTAERRRQEGSEVDDGTWGKICDSARRVGRDPDVWAELMM